MKVIDTVATMRDEVLLARLHTRRIAFVPTMGYLHAGHVSLLEEARRLGDVVVLSIFVNPTQFGPHEDLDRYPRDLDGDLAKARGAGVDLVFHPPAREIYPDGFQTYVDVRHVSKGLCGDRRPGHFVGVATVVLKLFQIIHPHVALFGEKDFQQLVVIKRMARDLHLEVAIVGMPIVREPDGLAMSSRNAYLSSEERARALCLSRAMNAARGRFVEGERDAGALVDAARKEIAVEPAELVRVDYLELCDSETLEPLTGLCTRPAVLAVAAHVGKTRLIDNVQLRG
jgi:pantoate--beta-alanine ligase